MACRFPDANGPAEFLDLVLSQRRAFRRLPPGRLGLYTPAVTERPAGPGPVLPPGGTAGVLPAGRNGAGGDTPAAPLPGPGWLPAGPEEAAAEGTGEPAGQPVPRAALIEGWRFDRAAFGVTGPVYQAADPAHWLALETAARALADGGFPGGQGLSRDRTGVIIGNTLTGEVSRAAALRSRWPYVCGVITAALADQRLQPAERAALLARAEARFLASLPAPSEQTLAGSLPSVIADRICGYFGFRGGGHAVDSAHSSSLLAVAAACSALATHDLDAVVAGGVDISLDPFELAGLAGMGVLADREMRVYDARPTGFWPGEGCGLVVLMRAADARAAGLPAYAQIAGWGTSSAGNPALTRPGSGSLLLALRRAHQRAGVDPADVQLIEGDGTGTASGDLAELTSLAEIRQSAPALAAIGSVKANIGHTKAAAGAAGLIKAALAMAAGVIPPVTGCVRPHPLITSEDARLRAPRAPEPWPTGTRLAGVSAIGPGGTSVHLVLRRDNGSGPRRRVRPPGGQASAASGRPGGRRAGAVITAPVPPPAAEAFVFSGPDRDSVAASLRRVAALAPWLSDAELHDLACQLGGRAGTAGPVRAALVARSQDELGQRASDAAALLRGLRPGRLTVTPGVYAADGGRGRVTLLFPGDAALMALPGAADRPPAQGDPALHPAILASSLASLRLLDRLGVTAAAAVGHGAGEIAGLVWAGCLTEPDAARLVAQRAALLSDPPPARGALVCIGADAPAADALCAGTGLVIAAYNGPACQVLAGPAAAASEVAQRAAAAGLPVELSGAPLACHTAALADRAAPLRIVLREFGFSPPARRLVSTVTGRDLTAADDLPELLCAQLTSPVRFTTALSLAAADTDLLVEAGPGGLLARLAGPAHDVPAVSLAADRAEPEAAARAVAALFAAGATRSLGALFTGRAARPIDIWRERTFITNPCDKPQADSGAREAGPAAAGGPGLPGRRADSAEPDRAEPDRAEPDRAEPDRAEPDRAEPDRAEGASAVQPGIAEPQPASSQDRAASAEAQPEGTKDQAAGMERGAGDAQPGTPGEAEPAPPPPGDDDTDLAVPGVAPWVRCFTEELRPPRHPVPAGATGPWRVRAARQPFGELARQVFADAADGDVVLAAVGGLADREAWPALLAAAGEAAQTGRLVVITSSAGLGGFCASLHSEQPRLGITLIRTAATLEALRAARRFATAEPGQLREIVLTAAAGPREPVMTPAEPDWSGTYPLGPADVVLISGMTLAGELACAGSLGYRGAALAVLCEPGGEEDPGLAACLAGLRAAGRRVWCETARLADAEAVAAAVAELETGLGPVTAVVHAVADGPAAATGELPGAAAHGYLSAQLGALGNVLAAVQPARLRLLMTFGSAAGRCGLPHGSVTALASEAVAEHAAARGEGLPGCRTLHVAWPAWPADPGGATGGDAPGQPADVPERSALLRQVLASPWLPGYLVVQGRPDAASAEASPGPVRPQGRFLETIRVHHPGVELIADARLSLRTDPYLADYQVDGLPVLPAVLALEAMAQAGAALAGEPLRQAGQVSMAAPVVVPAADQAGDDEGTVVRVCALRQGDQVEAVLRCADTGFRVDHARAVFRAAGVGTAAAAHARTAPARPGRAAPGPAAPAPPAQNQQAQNQPAAAQPAAAQPAETQPTETQPTETQPTGDQPAQHQAAAAQPAETQPTEIQPTEIQPAEIQPAGDQPARDQPARDQPGPGLPAGPRAEPAAVPLPETPRVRNANPPARTIARGSGSASGIVDGTDLYGPVCFQSGRFRRVAFLPEISSRSCRALVRGGDDQPWFGALPGPVDAPLTLGSPGLNDAALQVVQACLPHRRVLLAGCESVLFSGQEVRGALQVHAVRRSAASTGAHRRLDPGSPAAAGPGPAGPLFISTPGTRRAGEAAATGRGGPPEAGAPGSPGSLQAAPLPGAPGPVPLPANGGIPANTDTPANSDIPDGRGAAGRPAGQSEAGQSEAGQPGRDAAGAPAPAPAPARHDLTADPASGVWDVIAVDATGEPVVAWMGVRLRDVGPLARTDAWHPSLLAVSLESRAVEFGLDPSLRVTISMGQPLDTAVAGSRDPLAGPADPPGPRSGPGRADAVWADTAPGQGPLDGFQLAVRAAVPVAARWEPAGGPAGATGRDSPAGPAYARLRQQLLTRHRETPDTVDARLRAMAASLAALGAADGVPLAIADDYDNDWIVVRAGQTLVATAVVEINGVPGQAAVAIAGGTPPAGEDPLPRAGQSGLAPMTT